MGQYEQMDRMLAAQGGMLVVALVGLDVRSTMNLDATVSCIYF